MAQLEEDLSVSPGPHEKPGRYPHVIPHGLAGQSAYPTLACSRSVRDPVLKIEGGQLLRNNTQDSALVSRRAHMRIHTRARTHTHTRQYTLETEL